MTENYKRIIKNTMILYFRMLVIMGVSLYTARIVLETLGVVDYGINNVVGSLVVMFVFLNSALISGTQRFLTFELGKDNLEKLKRTFSTSLIIHIVLALIVLILSETIGLWFFHNKMNIPSERMYAAEFVFHFSVLASTLSIAQVPYGALIIAHEKMNIFAYISIVQAFLKLFIVYLLVVIPYDKLIIYAILTFIVSIMIMSFYLLYSRSQFEESKFEFILDKHIAKAMLGFSGWSLIGGAAWMLMNHGINIMLNIFFGPVVNAARGISFQINIALTSFVGNFRTAVNPQIIKSYASNNIKEMEKLAFISARYTYYLALFFILPILYNMEKVLSLWLVSVPEYTIEFSQLILIFSLIQTFDMSFGIVFQAIGKVKENQILSGFTYLLVLPVAYYIMTQYSMNPSTVYYVQIVAAIFVSFVVKIYLLKKIAKIEIKDYFNMVIFPIIKVTFTVIALTFIFRSFDFNFIANIFMTCLLIILSVVLLDMDYNMRYKILNIIKNKFNGK